MEINVHGQPVGDRVDDWSPRPIPGRVVLRGRYVSAEPIGPGHTADLYGALCGPGDEPLWTYRPAAMPVGPEEFEADVVRRLADDPGGATYAFVPTAGTAAGLATFFPVVPASGVVEISGVLWGRRLQRSTAATEAIHLLLGHAFDDLGYRRVEWKCDSLNEASRRAAERFGFTHEGRFRQHMVVKGRSRDTDWYAMLDTDWPTVRARHERWLAGENFDAHGRQLHRLTELGGDPPRPRPRAAS